MTSEGTGKTTGDRAVIYTRVSTEEQVREGMSLEAQGAACREYCQSHGLQQVRVFVEQGESAKTANRTQLKELLKFCLEDRHINFVVFYKIDRFSRNNEDYMQLRGLLARVGVALRSATEPIDDTPRRQAD
jgi:site-specific DNA recombinase